MGLLRLRVNGSVAFTYARRRQSCMGLLTGNGAWRGLEKGSTVFRRVQLTCVQEEKRRDTVCELLWGGEVDHHGGSIPFC